MYGVCNFIRVRGTRKGRRCTNTIGKEGKKYCHLHNKDGDRMMEQYKEYLIVLKEEQKYNDALRQEKILNARKSNTCTKATDATEIKNPLIMDMNNE